jgi:protein-disulfide isomerase
MQPALPTPARSTLFARAARPLAVALGALALVAGCSERAGDGAAVGAGANVKVDPYIGDVVMGDAAAPVTVVEYASLTCPHCRDFWKQQFPVLKERYIDTGKVKYILRDFPTAPAPVAVAAAAVARCKGEDQYYAVVDDIFSSWHEMMEAAQSSSGAGPVLVAVGGRHGMTPDEVRACANHRGVQEYIQKVVTEAADRVRATPTIFVDDVLVDRHTNENLFAAIDAKLNGGVAPAAPAATDPAAPASATPPAQ